MATGNRSHTRGTARSRGVSLALSALLLCLLAVGGCSTREPRLVIFVLLDAARGDRFDVDGRSEGLTPQMDRLAQRGVVFTRHFAQDTTTRASLPKLLFSRYFAAPLFPFTSRIALESPAELFMTQDRESVSLPRTLHEAGFHSAAISAHTWLREGSEFAAQFDELHDLSSQLEAPKRYPFPRAEQVIDYAIDWLDARPPSDVFLYLHLMDTHLPHFYEDDARAIADDPGLRERAAARFENGGHPKRQNEALEGDDRAYLDALYDGSLRYVDRHLGRLFEHLRQREELEDTLVVITADHGENLLEVAGRFDHSGPWFDTLARVPLIIHYPPALQAARVVDITEAVDVVPTILDLLDVEPAPGKRFDGESLVSLVNEGRQSDGHAFSRWGVRSDQHKLLLVGDNQQRALQALAEQQPLSIDGLGGQIFDIVRDPLEKEDLWSTLRQSVGEPLVDLWRERLERPYRRFLAAKAEGPPSSAFAIAARDFEFPAGTSVKEVGAFTRSPFDAERSGWQRSRYWMDYYLFGSPGAPQTQISFPLPNGVYQLTVSLEGSCELRVGDGPLLTLSAPLDSSRLAPLDNSHPLTAIEHYGAIRVIDERFRALLSPGDSESCRLRLFGFDPGDPESSEPSVDQQEYENRLKALGYVN